MFLTALCLATFASPIAATIPPQACRQEPEPCCTVAPQHGKLPWFEGTWEELQAEAKSSGRIMFVDFWSPTCQWCKRLDVETFTDDGVVAAMRDVLCFAVDIESEEGKPIARLFNIRPLPTLLFLETDGTVREYLTGFRPPKKFLVEIDHIKRNEGTITSLRRRVEADPENLEARYDLAMRLKMARDKKGFEYHMAVIQKLDPEGKSFTSRRVALVRLMENADRTANPTLLYEFVKTEQDPALLFSAWRTIHAIEESLMYKSRAEQRAEHRQRWLVAARESWSYIPPDEVGILGNNIAWGIYEARAEVGPADLAFAIELAGKAVSVLPEDANVVDTLACCLHAVGRKEEAIKLVKRCIELQPKNEGWKDRLREFVE